MLLTVKKLNVVGMTFHAHSNLFSENPIDALSHFKTCFLLWSNSNVSVFLSLCKKTALFSL